MVIQGTRTRMCLTFKVLLSIAITLGDFEDSFVVLSYE